MNSKSMPMSEYVSIGLRTSSVNAANLFGSRFTNRCSYSAIVNEHLKCKLAAARDLTQNIHFLSNGSGAILEHQYLTESEPPPGVNVYFLCNSD
jgi:hypothetical protein